MEIPIENTEWGTRYCDSCGGSIQHQPTNESSGGLEGDAREPGEGSEGTLANDSSNAHAPIPANLPTRRIRIEHTKIRSMAFSADGDLVASGAISGKIYVWYNVADEAKQGQLRWAESAHSRDVWALAFSPNGHLLASGSADCSVKIFVPRPGGKLKTQYSHRTDVKAIAFSEDSSYLVSGSEDGELRFWESKTGLSSPAVRCNVGVCSVVFSPTGNLFAAGLRDRTVRIWNTTTKQQLQMVAGHTGVVFSLAFSPQDILASGSGNSTALWDLETQTPRTVNFGEIGKGGKVLGISPNGRFLAFRDPSDMTLCIRDEGTRRNSLKLESWQQKFAFSPDSRIIAFYSFQGIMQWWDTESNASLEPPLDASEVNGPISVISFSPTGRVYSLATFTREALYELFIWNLVSTDSLRKPMKIEQLHEVKAITISPDDRIVASVLVSGITQLWDCETGDEVLRLASGLIHWVVFSLDGWRLATGGPPVHVWDLTTGNLIQVLGDTDFKPEYAVPAAFSTDGHVIATIAHPPGLQLWDTITGVLLRTLSVSNPILTVAFSTDNYLVAQTFRDDFINFVTESKWKVRLRKTSMPSDIVYALGFSRDGRRLASGASHVGHGDVAIWDTLTGRRVLLIPYLPGAPLALKYSANGEILMIGLPDGTVVLKNISSAEVAAS